MALAMGRDGTRVSGNAFWLETNHWKEFCEYEHELDDLPAGQRMIVMCTYALTAARAVDLLDVSRAHQFTIAKRHGAWEFLETPELRRAKEEINILNRALDVLSKSFPGSETLTPRERSVLAQVVKGATSKETLVPVRQPTDHRFPSCKYHAKGRREEHRRPATRGAWRLIP